MKKIIMILGGISILMIVIIYVLYKNDIEEKEVTIDIFKEEEQEEDNIDKKTVSDLKVVVDIKVVFVIVGIEYRVTAERNVRNHKVERIVCERRFFKAFNLNFRLRIQFRCDFTRNPIEFYAVKFCAACYLLRHKAEEIARSHCRL